MKVILNLDNEIVSIGVIDKIKREIEESKVITAKLIQMTQKIAIANSYHNYFSAPTMLSPLGKASTNQGC